MINPISSGQIQPLAHMPGDSTPKPAGEEPLTNRTGQPLTLSDRPNELQDRSAAPADMVDAIERVNHTLELRSTGLRFEMDEQAQRLVVQIVDHGSGQIIRQIPSEAMLQVAKMIVQLQGNGLDTQA